MAATTSTGRMKRKGRVTRERESLNQATEGPLLASSWAEGTSHKLWRMARPLRMRSAVKPRFVDLKM